MITALCALALLSPACVQQDRVKIVAGGQALEADQGESRLEADGRRMTVLTGRIEAALADQRIRADRAVAWSVDEGEEPKLRELYLEGNISYRRTDPKTKRETVFRAERLYVDFVAERLCIIELNLRAWSDRLKTPLVLRAAEARSTARGVVKAEDIVISTCTFGDPDYKVTVAKGRIEGKREIDKRTTYDLWPYEDWHARGEGISADLWGVPFFFLPAVAFGSALGEFPLRSVRGGNSSRFGTFVYSEGGFTIRKGWIDAINPWDGSDDEDDGDKWGRVTFELDWRQKRGFAGGLDLKWDSEGYHGYIDTYLMRDEGPDPGNTFDQKFVPLLDPTRWRGRTFNRVALGEDWRLELEASHLSDRNLLEEFFEKEFKEGKEQESAAYLRWIDGFSGAYLLQRHRLNDFQSQLEYLPRAYARIESLPVGFAGFTLSESLDAAHLRFRPDDDDPLLHVEQTGRVDSVSQLDWIGDLGLFTVAPFARLRATAVDHDILGEVETRVMSTAGGSFVSVIHGVHDVSWEGIGLRKIRHIARIEARYSNTVDSTTPPEAFYPYDETDRLDEFEEVALEMRHRFETKIRGEKGLENHQFLELAAEIEYYPDPGRDTLAPASTSVAPPFNWITLAPSDTLGSFNERRLSNLHWSARFEPRNLFMITAEGAYNPEDHQEEVRKIQLSANPAPTLALAAGEIFLKDVTEAMTVKLEWQITDRWGVHVDAQYDFENDDFIYRKGKIIRDYHDFLVELVYEDDEGRDERRVFVTFVPKFAKARD